jgi:hypothetical protein
MHWDKELFNYLNDKEYPKGSSKDDKRKLRSIAKKYVIKERKLNRDHSPNFFRQTSLLFSLTLELFTSVTRTRQYLV